MTEQLLYNQMAVQSQTNIMAEQHINKRKVYENFKINDEQRETALIFLTNSLN